MEKDIVSWSFGASVNMLVNMLVNVRVPRVKKCIGGLKSPWSSGVEGVSF